MIHHRPGVRQPSKSTQRPTPDPLAALRAALRRAGLPHHDFALERIFICHRHGLSHEQTIRALLLLERATPATPCAGCRRPLGENANSVTILGNNAFPLCPTCLQRGSADPHGAGAQIIRNAQRAARGAR